MSTNDSSQNERTNDERADMANDASAPDPEATEATDTVSIVQPEPAFGWTSYAEQINGRFAMLGFLLLLIVELFSGQDFFSWLGLR